MNTLSRRALMGVGGAAPTNVLKFTVNEGSQAGTITLTIPSGLTEQECTNIQYSLNGKTWVTFENHGQGLTITTPTLNAGNSVYFRGKATLISKSSSVYSQFTTSSPTFKISASGSIMSLLGDSETLTTMYAFYQLFYNCTSLTTAPELPATQLIEYCYQGMFQGCTSLTTAPELPATELKGHCYRSMFQGCSSLVNAPELPATKAEYYCYGAMFNGCSSLTTAPELPATVLANYCYQSMFGDCGSLTTAPILRAAETTRYSYENMFFNCTNINKITMLATKIGYNALSSWLYGVAVTGTFIKNPAMKTLPTGPSGIPSGWTIKDYLGPLKFTVNEGSSRGTIKLTIPSGLTQQECTNIEYSLDGQTWVTFENHGQRLIITTPTLNAGDSVYFRGQATLISKSSRKYSCFTTSSSAFRISASGSIMSLIGNSETLTSNAFYALFQGCKSLTTAPELPATTLAQNCYQEMFNGCINLTTAPALPATTLASSCYGYMFSGCASLTTAPALPATTLASSCYGYMFSGCTSLVTAPSLPATTLAYGCYEYMFYGCTSLVNASALPATTLQSSCYSYMFQSCTSLTTAPELPATTLASYCYRNMFNGCTSLTTAPALPATTLADYCYNEMFRACSQLNKITMLATDISASSCLDNWVSGVAATGTFIKNPAMTTLPTGDSGIPSGWIVKDYLCPLKFTVNEGSQPGTITLTVPSGLTQEECTNIEYSLDGQTWVTFVNEGNGLTITTPTLNAGDSVYFRGQATLISKSNSVYSRFTTSSSDFKISASGSVMSLIGNSDTLTDYAFYDLFYNCAGLTTAPELPATTLAYGCYRAMFLSCTSLTTAPELHATILVNNCYENMFNGCTSLATAPELPATTLAQNCYSSMFSDCTSLTTAPALPATTLANYCYNGMFSDCTSLTTAPALPAKILVNSCYYSMFYGCTSLTTAPALPATTLASDCYRLMFQNCTNLTTAPELPATILASDCYRNMFSGCTSLVNAPELPATTLANYCYSNMFSGCTSLTIAPALPATTLERNCYDSMFSGCTSLNYIKCLATDISANKCLYYWVYGVAATGTFIKNPAMTTLPTGKNGIPSGWTVEDYAG